MDRSSSNDMSDASPLSGPIHWSPSSELEDVSYESSSIKSESDQAIDPSPFLEATRSYIYNNPSTEYLISSSITANDDVALPHRNALTTLLDRAVAASRDLLHIFNLATVELRDPSRRTGRRFLSTLEKLIR